MKTTKERILAEGLDLLTETGFANITVGTLALRTHMSKSGLFAHFGSKEEVQLGLLEEAARVGAATFVEPAMRHTPGLERLRAVVYGWLGWTIKASLNGGCPIAAGLFEYDDVSADDPVRGRLLAMEQRWRLFLETTLSEAVDKGELRADLDPKQFVWELCGIYLNHHVSARFLKDPNANARAARAFEDLIQRSRPESSKGMTKRGTPKRGVTANDSTNFKADKPQPDTQWILVKCL